MYRNRCTVAAPLAAEQTPSLSEVRGIAATVFSTVASPGNRVPKQKVDAKSPIRVKKTVPKNSFRSQKRVGGMGDMSEIYRKQYPEYCREVMQPYQSFRPLTRLTVACGDPMPSNEEFEQCRRRDVLRHRRREAARRREALRRRLQHDVDMDRPKCPSPSPVERDAEQGIFNGINYFPNVTEDSHGGYIADIQMMEDGSYLSSYENLDELQRQQPDSMEVSYGSFDFMPPFDSYGHLQSPRLESVNSPESINAMELVDREHYDEFCPYGESHLDESSSSIEGHRVPVLSLSTLRAADARARQEPCLSPELQQENHQGLSFLIDVKNRVEALQCEIDGRQHGAVARQEWLFDNDAVLSVSADSQDSDDKSVVSLHSNVAIVSGRINPHKVLDALRAKLRREGKSVEEIEFELKCRMSPEEVKTEHHRRREIANRAIMKKKKAIDDAKERERRKMDLRGARPRRVPRRSEVRKVCPPPSPPVTPRSPVCLLGSFDSSPASPPQPEVVPEELTISTVMNEPEPSPVGPAPHFPEMPEPEHQGDVIDARPVFHHIVLKSMKLLSNTEVEKTDGSSNVEPSSKGTVEPSNGIIDLASDGENKMTDAGTYEAVDGLVPLLSQDLEKEERAPESSRKSYTHDQKIIVQKLQKVITKLFAELQKKYHRGAISTEKFEEEKKQLFKEIFECDESGKVFVKTSTPEAIKETRKRIRSCEDEPIRRRRAFRMPGWNNAEDTDAALEEDDIDGDCYDEDDSDDDAGTWVEVHVDDDYTPLKSLMPATKRRILNAVSPFRDSPFSTLLPLNPPAERRRKEAEEEMTAHLFGRLPPKETERRRKNFERREMMMRKIDQRAPPSDRMFQQDTSDGKPTPKQESDWKLWHTPPVMLPDWMKEPKERTVIFPENLRKMDN